MDDVMLADLKQFITTTVSQSENNLEQKLSAKIDALEVKVDAKIDALSAHIAEVIDNSNDTTDAQIKDHERRIKLLEQSASE